MTDALYRKACICHLISNIPSLYESFLKVSGLMFMPVIFRVMLEVVQKNFYI